MGPDKEEEASDVLMGRLMEDCGAALQDGLTVAQVLSMIDMTRATILAAAISEKIQEEEARKRSLH